MPDMHCVGCLGAYVTKTHGSRRLSAACMLVMFETALAEISEPFSLSVTHSLHPFYVLTCCRKDLQRSSCVLLQS